MYHYLTYPHITYLLQNVSPQNGNSHKMYPPKSGYLALVPKKSLPLLKFYKFVVENGLKLIKNQKDNFFWLIDIDQH